MTEPVLVGIPTYRGAENGEDDLLGWCLAAIRLRSGGSTPYEIVVVDDSGRPEHWAKSRAVAEKHGARWLHHPENRGVPAGWNTLTRSGDHSLVALLNDDFIVSPGWLDAAVFFLRENLHAASVGLFAYFAKREDLPRLLAASDAWVPPRDPFTKELLPEARWYEHHGKEAPGMSMAPTGCGFMFRRFVYDAVGGFSLPVRAFYEEVDFGTACAEKGWPSYCLQWPINYHIWSATFAQWSRELLPDIITARKAYISRWGQHYDRPDGSHRRFMSRISQFRTLRWLGPDGVQEGVSVGERQIPYAVNFGPPAARKYGDDSLVQCGIPLVVDVTAEDGTRHRVTLTLRIEDVQQFGSGPSDYQFDIRHVVDRKQEPL